MTVLQSARPPAPGAPRRGHHPALALTIIAASQLMVVLDATIVNIALPQIQQALGFSTTEPVVGAERLHPDLRRPAAPRWEGGRHPRPPPGVHRRHPGVHPGLVPRRPGHLIGLAAGRPRPAGGRRRHRRTDRALADHHQLRRGRGAQPGVRGVRGRGRGRRGHRPDRRRHPHLLAVVALGAVRQRAHRPPARLARPAVHHRVRAPAGHASTSAGPSPPPPG